jgi:hypothetical protein
VQSNLSSPLARAGIATGYGLDGKDSISGRDERFFRLSTASIPDLGPTQRPVPVVARVSLSPGREANAEVKRGVAVRPGSHISA